MNRSNQTHESTTDPDARLYKKSYGKESKLSYLGHALVENRNGLIAAAMSEANRPAPAGQAARLAKVDWLFVFSCAAHNLIRLPKLIAQPPRRLGEQCA